VRAGVSPDSIAAMRIVSPDKVPVTFTFFAANRVASACGFSAYTLLPDHNPYFEPFFTHRLMHFKSGVMFFVT
jgi:hypothetical protein